MELLALLLLPLLFGLSDGGSDPDENTAEEETDPADPAALADAADTAPADDDPAPEPAEPDPETMNQPMVLRDFGAPTGPKALEVTLPDDSTGTLKLTETAEGTCLTLDDKVLAIFEGLPARSLQMEDITALA